MNFVFCPRKPLENVDGNALEWTEGQRQLKMVQMFPESDAVSSARVAVLVGGDGVCCHVRPVKMPSQTTTNLALAGVIGESDEVHHH